MFTLDEANLKGLNKSLEFWMPQLSSKHPWIVEQVERDHGSKRLRNIVKVLKNHMTVKFSDDLTVDDLKILEDRDGKPMNRYEIEVVNDELIVTDEEGKLFEYNPKNKESQRIQETLFHEKQTIIENCLFGVDINANSVKICRLRLWIELLKNAYYKTSPQPSPKERE